MRKTVRKDILLFGIPALTVFVLGLIVSGRDGYDGLAGTIWDLIKHPENLGLLSAWNIAGLSLLIVGLTIAIVAACTLKRFYSSTLVTREDHQLITHGVYRFARHPLYFGVLIAIMGVPVYAPSRLSRNGLFYGMRHTPYIAALVGHRTEQTKSRLVKSRQSTT